MKSRLLVTLCLALSPFLSYSQSDGPKAHLPAPTGVWAINVKYLDLDQNFIPSGNILLRNSDLSASVFPVTLIHTFAIKNRYARVYGVITPASMMGTVDVPERGARSIDVNGFSDGFIAFETTLIGNDALNAIEFSKAEPTFTVNALFKFWYSGSYDVSNDVNLGTNRNAFDFGLPSSIPLSKNIQKQTWLEVWPGVQFFTDNTEPTGISQAEVISQKPVFYLESHLTLSITPKFYVGADFRFQQGGQTLTDEVGNDNQISILALGAYAGYKIASYLDFYVDYAGIVAGQNNAESNMLRLSLTFSYVNLKKIMPASVN